MSRPYRSESNIELSHRGRNRESIPSNSEIDCDPDSDPDPDKSIVSGVCKLKFHCVKKIKICMFVLRITRIKKIRVIRGVFIFSIFFRIF